MCSTRLALAGNCGGFGASGLAIGRGVSAASSPRSASSDDSAIPPMPVAMWPRKPRRSSRWRPRIAGERGIGETPKGDYSVSLARVHPTGQARDPRRRPAARPRPGRVLFRLASESRGGRDQSPNVLTSRMRHPGTRSRRLEFPAIAPAPSRKLLMANGARSREMEVLFQTVLGIEPLAAKPSEASAASSRTWRMTSGPRPRDPPA